MEERSKIEIMREQIIKEDYRLAGTMIHDIMYADHDLDFAIKEIKDLAGTLGVALKTLDSTIEQCKKFKGTEAGSEIKKAALTQSKQALDCISRLRTILRNM